MLYKQLLLSATLWVCVFTAQAQQQLPDSLHTDYAKQKSDTGRLKALWSIIDAYLDFRADSALLYGEESMALAKKIKSAKFESLTYKQIGDAYQILGDYPNALTFYLKRLEMDEKENDAYKKAVTLNSIGNVYQFENDYDKSLVYMLQAEKISAGNHFDDLKNTIYVNLCDLYGKKGKLMEAFLYGKKGLIEAQKRKDTVLIGISYNNIANVFAKGGQTDSALNYYQQGIPFLTISNTYHTLCESYIGIAQLMKKTKTIDSAIYYTKMAALLARDRNFNDSYLLSCNLLSHYFADANQLDSAYFFQSEAMLIKDSVFSDDKAKQLQLLTIKEEIRQKEIAEAAVKAAEERSHALQLLAIGLLIPVFFFISVMLSKRKIKTRVIELTGILSLLMVFEYITLLVHPAVAHFTNDTPVYEIIILIAIAAILTPAHHRIEEWLINKLTLQKKGYINIHTKKIKQKKPG